MIGESRKLTGLYITLGALLVLVIIAIVAIGLFGIDSSLFEAIGGYIMGIGGTHQGAQMMADRSPNYPNVAPTPPQGGKEGMP